MLLHANYLNNLIVSMHNDLTHLQGKIKEETSQFQQQKHTKNTIVQISHNRPILAFLYPHTDLVMKFRICQGPSPHCQKE